MARPVWHSYAERVGNDVEVAGPVRRALRWAKDRPLRDLAAALGVGALVLTAPFGGWADAKAPEPAHVTPGTVIHTGPLDITVTKAVWSVQPAENFTPIEGGHYLLVYGTARNATKAMLDNDELATALRVRGVTDAGAQAGTTPSETAGQALVRQSPVPYHRGDASVLRAIGPDLTYEVAWVFQRQGRGADLPTTLQVEVRGFTWRKDSTDGEQKWLDPTTRSLVAVPLTEKAPLPSPTPTPSATAPPS